MVLVAESFQVSDFCFERYWVVDAKSFDGIRGVVCLGGLNMMDC
jgi:hypothetical protein